MSQKEISYRESVLLGQKAWRDAKATGWPSLRQWHQTIDLPDQLASSIQTTVLNHLPIPDSIRRRLRREHPPIHMGWSLGRDDRDDPKKHPISSPVVMHKLAPIEEENVDDYDTGTMWINEAMTESATQNTIHHLHSLPPQTRTERFLKRAWNLRYAQTSASMPIALKPFMKLLNTPVIRDGLYGAWFSGDTDWATHILRHETGKDIHQWTLETGASQKYPDTIEDGGTYTLGSGVSRVADTTLWIPILGLLANAIGIAITKHPDILTYVPATLLVWGCASLIRDSARLAWTELAHETVHYFGEGERHMGWYPTTYHIQDNK